jgi:hypothetical protein
MAHFIQVLAVSPGISMMVPMLSGLFMEKRLESMTKLVSYPWQWIWMESFCLYAFIIVFISGPEFIHVYIPGRLIFRPSRLFPRSKHSKSASKSNAGINVLPTAVGCDAHPNLGASRVHRHTDFCRILSPTDSYHIDSPPAFPQILPIIFQHSSEYFLAHRSRMHFVRGTVFYSRATVGSILYAGISAV